MKKRILSSPHALSLTAALMLVPILAGCGGSGAGGVGGVGGTVSASASRAKGNVHFKIKWPAPATRLIPVTAQKITIKLRGNDGSSSSASYSVDLGQQDVVRPASDVTFPNIPPGPARLIATAYPDPSTGSTTAQATGMSDFTVVKNQTSEVSLTMATTITTIQVTPAGSSAAATGGTPANVSVKLHQSRDIMATAYDADGSIVLTSPDKWQWSTTDPATVSVVGHGETATITGAGGGGATALTALESESGVAGITAAQVALYDVIELAPFAGGDTSGAQAINDSGMTFGICGPYSDQNGQPHAHPIVWSAGGSPSDLGSGNALGLSGYYQGIQAVSLNNSGVAVGTVTFQTTDYEIQDSSVNQVFSSVGGAPAKLGPGAPALGAGDLSGFGSAVAIADDGHVLENAVSYYYFQGFQATHTGVFLVGITPDIATISVPLGLAIQMNNRLQVIGYMASYSTSAPPQPALFDGQTAQTTNLPSGMQPQVINDGGTVGGLGGDSKPVLWQYGSGTTTPLPLLIGDTTAMLRSININGWAVGSSGDHLALWHDGKVFDLSTTILTDLGWTLNQVTGINAHGQIVGSGTLNGKLRGFVLNPL